MNPDAGPARSASGADPITPRGAAPVKASGRSSLVVDPAASAESAGPSGPAAPPRLLDRLRDALRLRHYALRTEQAYVDWARRYILFHGKRHPAGLGADAVAAFLTHLAVDRTVAPSTQNQAKAALLFLYRQVLGVELPWLDEIVAAKDVRRLPVVLTPAQVRALLHELDGTMGLVASLLYGTGMRLLEGLRLRVKDVEFERRDPCTGYAALAATRPPARHCAINPFHLVRAAARWRAFTWPKPRMSSGMRAISVASARRPALSPLSSSSMQALYSSISARSVLRSSVRPNGSSAVPRKPLSLANTLKAVRIQGP
jgi:hypothetical protein